MNTAGPGQLSVRRYGASHGSHDHPHFQVLFGLDGMLELEVAGRGCRIGPGDARVVAPGERHDFEARAESRCLVLDSSLAGWSRCVDGTPDGVRLPALATFLAESVTQRTRYGQHSHALQLGPLLLLEAWTDPRGRSSQPRVIDWKALARWASAHWHGSLSVQDLAARVHLSATQFTTRCRQETALAPMQWLRLQRLAHARQLRQDGHSVAQAAQRCGYRSASALTAAIRRDLPGA